MKAHAQWALFLTLGSHHACQTCQNLYLRRKGLDYSILWHDMPPLSPKEQPLHLAGRDIFPHYFFPLFFEGGMV
jgi:hypothetical protein